MFTPAVSGPLALLAAATVAGTELTEGDQLQVQLILQLSGLFTEFWVEKGGRGGRWGSPTCYIDDWELINVVSVFPWISIINNK